MWGKPGAGRWDLGIGRGERVEAAEGGADMWVCGVSSTGTSAGCGEWLTCRPGWSVEGERARTRLKRGRKRAGARLGRAARKEKK